MLHQIDLKANGPHGESMANAISTCVHCGFCLAACPTYKTLGQEADSPRGRIVLMKEVLEGKLHIDQAALHVDRCLGCLACEPACPSGVPYRDLITPFRALYQSKQKRSLTQKLVRALAQATLPYPRRFRMAAMSGKLAKLAPWLTPKPLRVMLDLLPDQIPAAQSWHEINPAIGTQRGRVALLTGCAQSVLDPDINTATIEVLTRNGIEVIVPKQQGCCGALSWHVGNLPAAVDFAAHNLNAFPDDVDAIVTNAAGCGSGMQEYGLICQGTEHHDRALAFEKKVCDVSVYLQKMGTVHRWASDVKPMRIAYHDACHLASAQGVKSQPRELLRDIPGAEIVEITNAHLCCGSAGTYNIDQPEIAKKLGQEKAESIQATNPDIVASGNIGCLTQLSGHLKTLGTDVPVRHTMQVIRDAMDVG